MEPLAGVSPATSPYSTVSSASPNRANLRRGPARIAVTSNCPTH